MSSYRNARILNFRFKWSDECIDFTLKNFLYFYYFWCIGPPFLTKMYVRKGVDPLTNILFDNSTFFYTLFTQKLSQINQYLVYRYI